MHLVIYGPEGSGKGTQAKLLSQKLNLPVFASGDLVRRTATENKGKIGQAVRRALSEGKYVSDRIMFALWREALQNKKARKGFILDGFPRNINQARFLLKHVVQNDYLLDKVIYLQLSDEACIKRLYQRGRKLFSGSKINHDDTVRVRRRLKIYRKKEKEVLNLFKKEGSFIPIDASGSIDQVFNQIVKALGIDR